MLSNGFHTLKRSVTRLALFAAVQVVFCLWFAVFCAGLVSLGPLRLPYDVPGYWYGGLACLSTAFLPVWVAWTCNEAIDAARKPPSRTPPPLLKPSQRSSYGPENSCPGSCR